MDNEADKILTFFRFEDLRVYHKALDYIEWVHSNSSLFPENEIDNLTGKFVNSAQAIALQIAEGSSRGQLMELTKMIGALIGSLQRSNGGGYDEK